MFWCFLVCFLLTDTMTSPSSVQSPSSQQTGEEHQPPFSITVNSYFATMEIIRGRKVDLDNYTTLLSVIHSYLIHMYSVVTYFDYIRINTVILEDCQMQTK